MPVAATGDEARSTDFPAEITHHTRLGVFPAYAPGGHPYLWGLTRTRKHNHWALADWKLGLGTVVAKHVFLADTNPGAETRAAGRAIGLTRAL